MRHGRMHAGMRFRVLGCTAALCVQPTEPPRPAIHSAPCKPIPAAAAPPTHQTHAPLLCATELMQLMESAGFDARVALQRKADEEQLTILHFRRRQQAEEGGGGQDLGAAGAAAAVPEQAAGASGPP